MAEIYDCVAALKNLLNVEYEFVIARKGCKIIIKLKFEKLHFIHLMGLQYIRDVRALDNKAAVVFDNLYNHKISESQINSSFNYQKIKDRIHFLCQLEKILDDNKTVFKYNDKQNAFSLIHADFLLENTVESRNVFVFLAQNPDGSYFCRSFFPQEKYDYSTGQAKWTLLSKKKILKQSKEEIVLYSRGD